MKSKGYLSYGWDEPARAWVINYTARDCALGVTTSPSTNGHFIGIVISDNAAKRVSDSEDLEQRYKPFKGLLLQAGFWWFKFYVYIFFEGDGRL